MIGWLYCLRNGHGYVYAKELDLSVCLNCESIEEGNVLKRKKGGVLDVYKLKFEIIKESRPRRIVDSRTGRIKYRFATATQRLRTYRRQRRG